MTQEQFIAKMQEYANQEVDVSRGKNKDYAGSDDAFANFRAVNFLTHDRISLEDAIYVRMTDKMTRIANLLASEAAVKDEKISDTLLDLSNYARILRIYLDERMEANTKAAAEA